MRTFYHYDHADDRLTVETVQDVEPILEANKRQFDHDDRRFKSEAFNHVARVPLVVLEQWARDKGITYQELMNNDAVMRRFLNDPDNKFLRTKPGKI